MKTIGFIGAGNMGNALVKSLVSSNIVPKKQLIVFDNNQSKMLITAKQYGVQVAASAPDLMNLSDIIFLCVKPQSFESLCQDIEGISLKDKLIISIMAGVTTKSIQKKLTGSPVKIVRVMPNIAVSVQQGASGAFFGSDIKASEKKIVTKLLESTGTVVEVTTEEQIDVVTALSGSGPAYVYSLVEDLVNAGVKQGLKKELAQKLVLQTVFGAAALAIAANQSPAELKAQVVSPKGTTERALASLKKNHFSQTVQAAVLAAIKRAKELQL